MASHYRRNSRWQRPLQPLQPTAHMGTARRAHMRMARWLQMPQQCQPQRSQQCGIMRAWCLSLRARSPCPKALLRRRQHGQARGKLPPLPRVSRMACAWVRTC